LRALKTFATIAALTLAVGTSAAGSRTLEDSVYSRDQARAGKKIYSKHCRACHERGYFREVLRTHRGETLDLLFEIMVTEMPQNAPGSLRDEEYVDVIAYIISQARYADGERDLSVADLDEIVIPDS